MTLDEAKEQLAALAVSYAADHADLMALKADLADFQAKAINVMGIMQERIVFTEQSLSKRHAMTMELYDALDSVIPPLVDPADYWKQ
jgi:hypothetical protein